MRLNIMSYLIIIIVFLGVSVSVQTCRVQKVIEQRDIAEADRASAIQFANETESKTELYSNAYNHQVARTKATELSLANVQALRNTDRLSFLKQFNGLQKDYKNLQEGIKVVAEIDEDSIPRTIVYLPCRDSVKVFQYQLIDEWNTISALVLDTPRFEIKVPIYSAVSWQRKNKFLFWRVGRKEYFIESTSPNPIVKITKQDLIQVSKKD